MLSFWGGTEDTYGHMKDGSRHIGHNVNVRAARDGAVELSNKRETFFEEVKRPAAMQCYEPRCHTAFSALRQTALEDASETSGAAGGMREVDVVGLLLEAVPEEATGAHVFFLLDDSEQLVAVRSWHGNAKSLVPGSVLCATSVEWKSFDARHDVLHLHAGELSTFGVRAPRHLQEALAALTHWSKACPDAVERNQRRVQDLVAGRSTGAAADTAPGLATPAPSTRGGGKTWLTASVPRRRPNRHRMRLSGPPGPPMLRVGPSLVRGPRGPSRGVFRPRQPRSESRECIPSGAGLTRCEGGLLHPAGVGPSRGPLRCDAG